jgi:ABC-type uncharacterized transport system substrate-binding protein
MTLARSLAVAVLCGAALPAAAHPHIFVETGLELLLDEEGRAAAVRVTWEYDELYSFLITEEMGLDDDYDGQLTEAERERLVGFDLNWLPDFEGDLYAHLGGAPLALDRPLAVDARFEDGKIVTVHDRPIAAPPPPGKALVLEAYDPTFYTLYEVTLGVRVAGEGCEVEHRPADIAAATDLLEEALFGLPEEPEDFPAVGAAFADKIVVRCGAAG